MDSTEKSGFMQFVHFYMNTSLILLIAIGMIVGIILGVLLPQHANMLQVLGDLFVGALKGIAPILVFVLVTAALASHTKGNKTELKPLIFLYLLGTFLAASLAVIFSFLFPSVLLFQDIESATNSGAGSVTSVIMNLVTQIVANPVSALLNANYISLIFWAVLLGLTFQNAKHTTKDFLGDLSNAVSSIVRLIVRFAPFGVCSLVYSSVAIFGVQGLYSYLQLLYVLLGTMLFVALVVNPLIVYFKVRQNPYPLVWFCIKNSGITAFFTRSSAANIPVNMDLCRRLNLAKETYTIAIPLGASINMAGAAITVTVLTLAAANTLGIQIDIISAILLSVLASVCACGASGVAGGSLMLIPLACSLFSINNEVALQVVGIGFVIGVLQDSMETALNSSTDVVFTAAVLLSAEDNLSERVKTASMTQ